MTKSDFILPAFALVLAACLMLGLHDAFGFPWPLAGIAGLLLALILIYAVLAFFVRGVVKTLDQTYYN